MFEDSNLTLSRRQVLAMSVKLRPLRQNYEECRGRGTSTHAKKVKRQNVLNHVWGLQLHIYSAPIGI